MVEHVLSRPLVDPIVAEKGRDGVFHRTPAATLVIFDGLPHHSGDCHVRFLSIDSSHSAQDRPSRTGSVSRDFEI
jgi:hypothetical protein